MFKKIRKFWLRHFWLPRQLDIMFVELEVFHLSLLKKPYAEALAECQAIIIKAENADNINLEVKKVFIRIFKHIEYTVKLKEFEAQNKPKPLNITIIDD